MQRSEHLFEGKTEFFPAQAQSSSTGSCSATADSTWLQPTAHGYKISSCQPTAHGCSQQRGATNLFQPASRTALTVRTARCTRLMSRRYTPKRRSAHAPR
eukprot:365057-Chlamydomonas_euryale.AAC.27